MVLDHDDRIDARGRRTPAATAALAVAAVLACTALAPSVRADDAATAPPAAAAPAADSDAVVAQRGDIKMTAGELRDLIRFSDPEQRHVLETNPTALQQAVRDRLLKRALMAQATEKQWDKREDVAFRAAIAREDAITSSWLNAQVAPDPAFPTDEQVQAAYDANKAKFVVPRQFHVAQIFLALPPGAGKQTDDELQHKLADLRQQVTKQHADFAVLAKRYSDEKASAANGGDLGWVREDTLVPPMRATVQGLAEGAVAEPVRGPNGWHLLKLVAIKPASQATLAEVRETLVKLMRQERQVEGQRAYLANMLKQEPVEVNEIELSKFIAK
jgi:peptidylprolyl isomerase